MSSIVIAGNTSGTVTLSAPDVAGTTTLTLPSSSGTVITTATTSGISGTAISSGVVGAAYGGTGASTLSANAVILGNGTSAVQTVAPSTSGNVLTSNGTTWVSQALPAGGVTSLNGQTGAITNTNLYAIGSYVCARPQNESNYSANTTIAGSSLYNCGPRGSYDSSYNTWVPSNPPIINTGTWRCMSMAALAAGDGAAGLWVRIS